MKTLTIEELRCLSRKARKDLTKKYKILYIDTNSKERKEETAIVTAFNEDDARETFLIDYMDIDAEVIDINEI